MKKILNDVWMVILVGCLSFVVTSCKDDDNTSSENGQSGEQTVELSEQAETFWSVAASLVSPFDVTDDYQDKTFEPTIGTPLNDNNTVRVVPTGGLSAAAERFADLTGADVNENTTTFTYHNDAVGTLTYNKSTDGQSLATVDVNIKQIPGLQRIVYKTQEQIGENGTFRGTPFYSFGDVIKLTNTDGKEEYWVCVRPALGKAGKETTHWVTVSNLPSTNIKTLQISGKTVKVPTKIAESKEHMQNLAEMLYAIFYPERWAENVKDYSQYSLTGPSGLRMFYDLKPERAAYFNKYFWEAVYYHWIANDIFKKLFNLDYSVVKKCFSTDQGLHLLAKGYTGKVGLYQYVYKSAEGAKSNMHDMTSSVVKKTNRDFFQNNDFDVEKDYKSNWVNEAFFGDNAPRFIFRTATGRELFGSSCTVYDSICGGPRHIENVYVFNKEMRRHVGRNYEHAVTKPFDLRNCRTTFNFSSEKLKVGAIIGKNGGFYSSKIEADTTGGGAMAIVVCLNDVNRVEDSTCYNGLAIAIDYPVKSMMWGYGISSSSQCKSAGVENYKNGGGYNYEKILCGLSDTKALAEGCRKNHQHEPALACINNDEMDEKIRLTHGFSQWFLPSYGQVILALKSLGLSYNDDGDFNSTKLNEKLFTDAGVKSIYNGLQKNRFYLSTRDANNGVFIINPLENNNKVFSAFDLKGNCYILPFIAFMYDFAAEK